MISKTNDQKHLSKNESTDKLDLQSNNKQKLLSTKEAADYLGLRPQTLANWRHNRKGPDYSKIGGLPRYERKVLDNYINSKRVILNS